MKKIGIICCLLLICISCKVSPQKIEYGVDVCSFCDMTIVEKSFASEIVTKKGKAYKFDSIECLIHDIKNKNEEDLAFIIVADFLEPETLIDVKVATFLISEEIKSPMGENISAFKNKEKITQIGATYDWSAIKNQLKK